jgi:pyruvate ferredoxin oxidoreductase alpha subunit
MEGLVKAETATREIFEEFAKTFKRGSADLLDEYQTDDAEIAIVVLAATAGTIRGAVDILRKKGIKAGMIRPKIFRPFPADDLRKSLGRFKKILVLDRMLPAGAEFGALGAEIAAIFCQENNHPTIRNCIYGLGSRETTAADFAAVAEDFDNLPIVPKWINLRD